MAKVGVKYCKVGTRNDTAGTFSDGRVIGAAINIDVQINMSKGQLWGDNVIKETRTRFKDGTIKLEVDDITQENQAYLLGHKISDTTVGSSTVKTLVSNVNDVPPLVGCGFYQTVQRSNVDKYRALVILKTQFSEPKDTAETAGESIKFGTASVDGDITTTDTGDWKKEATFDTEAEAKAFIDSIIPDKTA